MPKRSKERGEEEERGATSKTKRPWTIIEPNIELRNVEDHKVLEDLWQAAFSVGTEWDQMDTIYKINWDFSNLEDSFEEGGALYGKTVYLFGCTEPTSIDGKGLMIPAVVAVVSPFPPSDKIAIKSVQMKDGKVVPMKEMKMGWVPYIPYNKRHLRLEQLQFRIHTLKCTQRRAALKQLHKERIMQYNYCIPYFYHPLKEDKTEDKMEEETVVEIMYPSVPPVECEFVCGFDNFEDFTAELVQAKQLTEEKVKDFKNFLKQRVKEEKKKQREEREKQLEARKKEIEEMSPETRAAFENMRFYKFYPATKILHIYNEKKDYTFINRFYPKAHEVFITMES